MSLKNVNHQKRSFTWSMEKPSAKDYFLTVFIFVVCTLIGLLFQKLNFTDTNIVTIYSGNFAYFDCDRWLSLQCGRLFFKCIFILFFSDRTKDVF